MSVCEMNLRKDGEIRRMTSCLGKVIATAIAVLALSSWLGAQTSPGAPAKRQKPEAAPRRDLSGIWDVEDVGEGIAPMGVKSHAPFTALGANLANSVYKPGDGPRKVP